MAPSCGRRGSVRDRESHFLAGHTETEIVGEGSFGHHHHHHHYTVFCIVAFNNGISRKLALFPRKLPPSLQKLPPLPWKRVEASTEAAKAFVAAVEVSLEASTDVLGSFKESFHGSTRKLPWKLQPLRWRLCTTSVGVASVEASTEGASREVLRTSTNAVDISLEETPLEASGCIIASMKASPA